jgi:hypothetical protein
VMGKHSGQIPQFFKTALSREQLEALPRTCKEAKTVGASMYYTGRPCSAGHIAARYTVSATCVSCHKLQCTRRKSQAEPKSLMSKIDDLKLQAELKALEEGE